MLLMNVNDIEIFFQFDIMRVVTQQTGYVEYQTIYNNFFSTPKMFRV